MSPRLLIGPRLAVLAGFPQDLKEMAQEVLALHSQQSSKCQPSTPNLGLKVHYGKSRVLAACAHVENSKQQAAKRQAASDRQQAVGQQAASSKQQAAYSKQQIACPS